MAKLSAAKRRAAQAVYYKAWYARTQKAFIERQGKTYTPRFVWRYATEAQRCEKLRALKKAQRERKRQDADRG